MELSREVKGALFSHLLRLGDDLLVLGHRLSEWCGHAPILEEDIAMANIALDCLGGASSLLRLAGEIEGKGRNEDSIAYLRELNDFRNCRLVEFPKGDFAFTIARQLFFDAYAVLFYGALKDTKHPEFSGIAGKTFKESQYHLRHSREWVIRLGDGTDESHTRIQTAIDQLWEYTPELFLSDAFDALLVSEGLTIDPSTIKSKWSEIIDATLSEAKLIKPALNPYVQTDGARRILHTEHLGHLLSVMQSLPRAHPGAVW